MLRILLALALFFLPLSEAAAGSSTITTKDAAGTTRTFVVTTDGSGNFVGQSVICDGMAAANCAAVDSSGRMSVLAIQPTAANLNATVVGTGTFATQSAVTAASGSFSSGALASGSVASGAFASGSLAAGSMVDFLTIRGTKNNGTAAANSALVGGVYNSTPLTLTDTQQASLQADANGYLKVNVAAGGASGGTSSSFGAAMPATGTAIGLYDGTNMVRAKGDETSGIWVNIKAGAGSGGTALADEAAFTQGTTNTTPMGCLYTTSVTNLTTGQAGAARCTNDRQVMVSDAALLTAFQSATPAGTNDIGNFGVAQASTTSGQKGPLSQGAVTTGAPTYTTAQTNPLSLTTAGDLRVVFSNATIAVTATNLSTNVAQFNGVTPLMGNGASGTGAQRVSVSNDSSAIAGWGQGATGAAPPSGAVQIGANASGATGGLMAGLIQCDSTAIYDASTSGSTELKALTSGRTIYVCGYSIVSGGTVNVKLIYGTGTACATGSNNMTPAYQLTAQVGIVDGAPFSRGLKTASANALCLNTSAGVAVQAIVYYAVI